jgi:energy-coupling factor transporter transmembrane protein EcfT
VAQRIVFHYFPTNSLLHRWDARSKLLGLLMMNTTLLQSNTVWLILDTTILVGLLIISKLPLGQFFRDFRMWVIFLLVLFIFQAFFSEGPWLRVLPWLPVSKEGLLLGGLTCWRLGLMLSYAILFSAITRPRELRDALIWFLKPIPFLPERRIGLMASLTLNFFSIILDQAEETRLAQKARQGDRIKNPFRKTKYLILPVLRRSLIRAEDIAYALAARGYRDDIPLHLSKWDFSQIFPLIILLGILTVLGGILF